MNWPPPAEQIPLLPVEVLALSILKLVAQQPHSGVHRHGLIGTNGRIPSIGAAYRQIAVLDAVNEAWEWLFTNGLTVNIYGEWNVPSERMEGYRVVSRKGMELAAADDPLKLIQAERLIALPLHPRIEAKARIQFAIGAYGSAVLEAFKELEIRVRAAGGFGAQVLGDNLMRQAFNENTGKLTDYSLVPGERRAIMELYAGAMGAFKNPLSHRTVDYDDPTIAAEQLMLADLLHRMLDGFETAKDAVP